MTEARFAATRRTFLAGTSGLALLAMLESCSTHHAKGGPGEDAYAKALRLLHEAVQASPDHLTRRADDVVATKNADKIVAFVRDNIAVVPSWSKGDDSRSARRWGSAATLRGGQGTVRERADLTAELLNRAGIKAGVKVADRPASLDAATLYRPRPVECVPDQKKVDQARALFRSVGINPAPAPAAPPNEPDPVAAILAALPASTKHIAPRDDLLPDSIPVVWYEDHGTTKYAFALGSTAATTAAPAGLADAPDADQLPTITVKVQGLANPAPGSETPRGQLIDLVSGEWGTDKVVGRQILLTFVPQAGPAALLRSRAADLPVRIPVLRVQTETPPGPPDLVKAGPMINLQGGDVINVDAHGGLDGGFGPITVLSKDATKAAVARVNTVRASANVAAFPEVELLVSVLDGGASVDGLDATAFTVTDDGKAVSGLSLRSNSKSPHPPRVLLAYDTSGSISWPTAAAQSTFEHALASTLTQVSAQTPIETQVVALGSAPAKDAWAAPATDTVIDGLHSAGGSSSAVWDTVGGEPLDAGPTAIIIVTDFNADDDPAAVPGYQHRLAAAGVPVLCLPIGDVNDSTLTKIVSLSGGSRLDPKDPALANKLAALIKPLAAKRAAASYRLTYIAPTTGPATRPITVTVGHATGRTSYQVPKQPAAPPSFVGLYATITVNGVTTTRRLAGVPINDSGTPLTALDDPGATAETRAAIYGFTTFAFEPGTTTTGAMLDDGLSSLISVDPVRRIWPTKPTPDEIRKAVGAGIRRTPLPFVSLLRPASVTAGATTGLRVVILQERMGATGADRHVDLPPTLNSAIPLGGDPTAAFHSAVSVSIGSSVAEAATFPDSAFARLRGQRLTAVQNGDAEAFLETVPAAQQAAWHRVLDTYSDKTLLVPPRGQAGALWVVDPDTGSVKATLLDATGGAIASPPGQGDCGGNDPTTSDYINLMLGLASFGCSLAGPAAASPLGIACIGITVAGVVMSVVGVLSNAGSLNSGDKWSAYGGYIGALGLSLNYVKPLPYVGRVGTGAAGILMTLGGIGCL